ncbi:MAG: hypothetical protein HUU27_09660, partial [Phycisphaerae bacterium]|nr:hypothetical protein [Phycisphaerae bacterium]
MTSHTDSARSGGAAEACRSLHMLAGWWSLLVFLTFGLVLELLHGFKAPFYLDLENETRRLLWTLAHAHGTLLALVNIAFAVSLSHLPGWTRVRLLTASRSLLGSTALLPAGFLLGGAVIHHGDPGLGIALVPLGAALLMVAVFCTALSAVGPRPARRDADRDRPAS